MKRAFTLLFLAAMSFALCAQQLTRDQKIERILDLTNSEALVQALVGQVDTILQQIQANPTEQQKARRKEALDKVAKLARERLQKVRPAMVKAYNETFTDEEIDAMLAWYSSPVGHSATQKLPAVGARISAIAQPEIMSLNDEINKITEDSLKR
jgi:hypothetical protein